MARGGAPARNTGRWLRLLLKAVTLLVVLVVAYLGVTFVQVYGAKDDDHAGPADAIVVLGAAQYDGRPSRVLRDRLDHALALYRDGIADRIVLTGGRKEGDRFTEATAGYNYLRAEGLPDEALLREVHGTNTYESLAATARFLRIQDRESVVLVTDGYHAFRVGAIADDLGLDAEVSPSSTRLSGTTELRHILKETVAVAAGRVIGWDRLFRLDAAVND